MKLDYRWFKADKKILILYPNVSMSFALPHSIAILSSCLKKRGCTVELFDTTLYKPSGKSDDDLRVELGQFPHVDVPGVKTTNMYVDLQKKVNSFRPDMIMVSFVDNTVELGLKLLGSLKEHIFTIAGGVSVICNPSHFLGNPLIDFIWEGSAESLILGKETTVFEDFSIFEDARFYRPWSGTLYKTIPWHTDRVCPYSCSFCCAKKIREKIKYKPVDINSVLNNLVYQIKKHKPKFIHITSESFLSMSLKDLKRFADVYKDYNIPFWCQSHVRDITEEKISIVKKLGCFKIALGIECGNEEYRRKMINKFYSNKDALKAVYIISYNGIRVGLNSIIGLPMETPELIADTIILNKKLYTICKKNNCPEIQVNCYLFQPFHGTALRDFCVINDLLIGDGVGVVNQGDIVVSNPFVTKGELRFVELHFNRWVKDE